MNCPRCYYENSDSAVFCARCGCHIASTEPAVPFYVRLKEICSSPLFLCLCLSLTFSILLELVSVVSLPSFFEEYMSPDVDYYYGSGAMRMELAGIIGLAVSIFSAICTASPQIVLLIGFWMMYAFGRRKAQERKISGLALVKTSVVITEVFSYVVMGFIIILTGVALLLTLFADAVFAYTDESYMRAAPVLMFMLVPILVIFLVLVFLTALYYTKLRRIINSTKVSYETCVSVVKRSKYVFVIHFIFALISLVNAIPATFTVGIVGFLSSLASGAFHLILGIILTNKFENVR